ACSATPSPARSSPTSATAPGCSACPRWSRTAPSRTPRRSTTSCSTCSPPATAPAPGPAWNGTSGTRSARGPASRRTEGRMGTDVVVVGAGIVGAACARALAVAGASVTVLDRGAAASATSAHGEGNVLVSDKGPGPELDLTLVSVRRWATLAAELADELGPRFPSVEHEPKGGLVVVAGHQALAGLRAFAAGQRAAGVEALAVTGDDARALEPDLAPAVLGGVHYPQDAQVQPVVATEALLASARGHGAVVRTGVEVTGALRGTDGRLTGVTTTSGAVPGGAVVVA